MIRDVLTFIAIVIGGTLLSVLLPILVVWIWVVDLFNALWRHLWK